MENKKMYETRRLQFSERRRFLFDKTVANYCLTNEPVQCSLDIDQYTISKFHKQLLHSFFGINFSEIRN